MKNTLLNELVTRDSGVKQWLVDYVGKSHNPKDDEVTVEMIVETMATEFPEFLLVVAEENWLRGYQQALEDVELGQKMLEEEQQKENDEQAQE